MIATRPPGKFISVSQVWTTSLTTAVAGSTYSPHYLRILLPVIAPPGGR